MNLFKELLVESTGTDLVTKFKPLTDDLSAKIQDQGKEFAEKLGIAVDEDKIYNVDFNEIKDFFSRSLEKTLSTLTNFSRTDDRDNSPNTLVYMADISSYVYLNQAKGQVKKIKDFLAKNKDFPADDVAKLKKMLVANETAVMVQDVLTKLKPKVIKGRRPAQEVNPNAFYSKLGSQEAQKIVKEKLETGVKKPLDDYETSIRKWFQSIINSISNRDVYTQSTDRSSRDPITDSIFFQCFDFDKDIAASNKDEIVYKNVKITEKGKNYAAKEAKDQRDGVETRYLTKNIKKLSNIIDLKKNLSKIEELPYHAPAIKNGSAMITIESGFKFLFADGSEFKVINKIVSKYSFTGKKFEQFPTTFHDVKMPDGTKMKSPSEEKMVKEFTQTQS